MDELNIEELSVDMDAEFAKDEAAFDEAIRRLSTLTDGGIATETAKFELFEKLKTLAAQGHAGARAKLDAIPSEQLERVTYLYDLFKQVDDEERTAKEAAIKKAPLHKKQARILAGVSLALIVVLFIALPVFSWLAQLPKMGWIPLICVPLALLCGGFYLWTWLEKLIKKNTGLNAHYFMPGIILISVCAVIIAFALYMWLWSYGASLA
jgi:cation transport ATPase